MPLTGIKVIELCANLAGPLVGTVFGDLGAEVIKIERPGSGDDARGWAPPFWHGKSVAFQAFNRNKRSVTVDLRDPEEMARLKTLIAEADILVHNMRPGAMEKLGLGADAAMALNPRLIYCAMGAFGSIGPMKDRPGYDALAQAFSGVMESNGQPDGPPTLMSAGVIDRKTGMWTAIAALGALYRREATGRGGVVETSLLETALALGDARAIMFMATGKAPKRQGNSSPVIVPYGKYETATGPIMVACAGDSLFAKFAEALGHSEWCDDERFGTNPQRVANRHILEPTIGEVFAGESRGTWLDRLDAAGVPCAPIQNIGEALNHPQVQALGILQKVPDSDMEVFGAAWRLDGERPPVRRPAPDLGEDNDIIFAGAATAADD